MSSSTENLKVLQYVEFKYFLSLTRRVLLTGFICIAIRHFLTNENENYNLQYASMGRKERTEEKVF